MTIGQPEHILFRQKPDSHPSPTWACPAPAREPKSWAESSVLIWLQRGLLTKNWDRNSVFPMPSQQRPLLRVLNLGAVIFGLPQPLGGDEGMEPALRDRVCIEKTLDLEPTWVQFPTTPWLCPTQLGQLHLSSCSGQEAKKPACTFSHTHIQTISKYLQLHLNMYKISNDPFPPSLCSPALQPWPLQPPSPWRVFLTSPQASLLGSPCLC